MSASPEYLAEWVDEAGAERSQRVSAADRAAALASLPGPARFALRRLAPAPDAEAARAASEMARSLAGGTPLPAALEALAGSAAGVLQADLLQAARAAAEGASLEQALRGGQSPLAQDELLGALACAARPGPRDAAPVVSGLRLMAGLLAWRHQVRSRVRSALLYPALVAALLPLLAALLFTALGAREARLAETGQYAAAPASAQEAFLRRSQAAAARPGLAWGVAAGLALLAGSSPWWLAGVAASGRGLVGAQRLLALAELVRAGLSPDQAWALAGGGAAAGAQSPAEGASWSASLRGAGLITERERAALAALEAAPPSSQAAELAALGQARLGALERRARAVAALLHVLVLLGAGAGVAWMGARLLGGEAPA